MVENGASYIKHEYTSICTAHVLKCARSKNKKSQLYVSLNLNMRYHVIS